MCLEILGFNCHLFPGDELPRQRPQLSDGQGQVLQQPQRPVGRPLGFLEDF